MWTYVLLLWVSSLTVHGQETITTNGVSGPKCGASRCLRSYQQKGACADDKCVCVGKKSKGFGNFVCATPEQEIFAIFSDPAVHDVKGYRTKLPLFFKVLAARVRTQICPNCVGHGLAENGTCDVRFYAFGQKYRGKSYVGGFVLEIRITYLEQAYGRNYQFTGNASGGVYQHTFSGNTDFNSGPPYGYATSLLIPGVGWHFVIYDPQNNFLGLGFPFCGISAALRPLDKTKRFEQTPGTYLIVDDHCEPQFLDTDITLSSSPQLQEDILQKLSVSLSHLTGLNIRKEVAGLFRILIQKDIRQDFPGASSVLQSIKDLAEASNKTDLAIGLHHCIFLLEIPRLIMCIDPSDEGDVLLDIFLDCLAVFCLPDGLTTYCSEVKAAIQLNSCHNHIPAGVTSVLGTHCQKIDLLTI